MDTVTAQTYEEVSNVRSASEFVLIDPQADLEIDTSTILGAGGFGRTMTALFKRGGGSTGAYEHETVAVKMMFASSKLPDELLNSFHAEAYTMSQLRHPNVVHLFGACIRQPHLCLVQELSELGRCVCCGAWGAWRGVGGRACGRARAGRGVLGGAAGGRKRRGVAFAARAAPRRTRRRRAGARAAPPRAPPSHARRAAARRAAHPRTHPHAYTHMCSLRTRTRRPTHASAQP
jgi:hypothetical protein